MNANSDKKLEKLIDKIMKDAKPQTPSFDFTNKVMSKVNALNTNSVTVYKPLISKTGWLIICIILLALTVYIATVADTNSTGILSALDFSALRNNKIAHIMQGFELPGITVSKTVVYSLFFFGIMVCVQIPLLKHHFNKRLEH
jgi:hypothetical protein